MTYHFRSLNILNIGPSEVRHITATIDVKCVVKWPLLTAFLIQAKYVHGPWALQTNVVSTIKGIFSLFFFLSPWVTFLP